MAQTTKYKMSRIKIGSFVDVGWFLGNIGKMILVTEMRTHVADDQIIRIYYGASSSSGEIAFTINRANYDLWQNSLSINHGWVHGYITKIIW